MQPNEIIDLLAGKWLDGIRPKDIYKKYVVKTPEKFVVPIIDGLLSDVRKVQNGCSELASLLSESHPSLLYPHIDVFVKNLSASAKVLRWEAVCTLGNLSPVDSKSVIPSQIDALTHFLVDDSIVLQGHTVRALAKIAAANPKIAPGIVDRIIASVDAFEGNKVGFVIEALTLTAGIDVVTQQIREFIEQYLDSDVKVVARKAKKALKQLDTTSF